MVDVKEIEDVHVDLSKEGLSTYAELTGTVEVDSEEIEAFLEDLDDLIQTYQRT